MSTDTSVPSKTTKFMQFSFLYWNMDHAESNTIYPAGTFRQSLNFQTLIRRWINVEISTSNSQRFFDVFSTPNKIPLKYRRWFEVVSTSKFQRLSKFKRFFDDRRNILTFFNAFSTSIQRWINVENAHWVAIITCIVLTCNVYPQCRKWMSVISIPAIWCFKH